MKPAVIILKLVIISLLASCATSGSPPVSYYHLYANTETLTQLNSKATYSLQPVEIPEIIKRQAIVSYGSERNSLNISKFHLWAGDLREMVYESLIILLRHQLPQAQISAITSSSKNDSEFKLSIQLQEFIGQLNGECSLRASWQVVDQSGNTVIDSETVLSINNPDASYAAYVLVLNQLLSEFSQVVAKELSTIQ